MKLFKTMLFLALAIAFAGCFATNIGAQTLVSGEIDGTVTDASGAVVPGAPINLTSSETGFNENTTTGSNGTFRFALVKPGTYTLTVTAKGFSTLKRTVIASTGQVLTIPIQLEVGTTSQTIEITAAAPLLQTENGNIASTIDRQTIEQMPSPGQDITNYALMTPGVTVSTGGGYGNFTANGQPGTSNLYTVNGNDYNDPYNNLNNSGASNLLLGANELQEITVVANGYTGEYGRAAGANVNYSTKSGSNQFHGNAGWWWNGSLLNANDWFSNSSATPRGHAVSNQYVGSVGGPIVKDKLFFFFDYEGLRYVLPGGGGQIFTPTDAFASATLANLAAGPHANEVPFYTTIFNLYKGAPGSSSAPAALGNCGDLAGVAAPGGGVFDDAAHPCAKVFQSNVNSLNTERLYAITVDWNASPNDTVKFRYKNDYGVQATGTDPINAGFNANSVQPEKDGQLTWTHVINNHTTNQLIAGGLYYGAIFGPPNINASLAVFPTTILFNDGAPFTNLGGGGNQGGGNSNYPQGRNVSQYQIVDDFSWTKGNHGIKFGVNYRGNRISSYASGLNTSGLLTVNSLQDFYSGVLSLSGVTGPVCDPTKMTCTPPFCNPNTTICANGGDTYIQAFAKQKSYPESYYSLGLYVQDEVRVNSRLKLTFALRIDRNANEVCRNNCYARTAGSFANTDHNISTPYDQTIQTGLHTAFPQLQPLGWGPRVGFAWTPTSKGDLVVRGGGGIFTQLYPGLIGDRLITNLPNVTSFTVTGASGDAPIALGPQGVPGGVRDQATQSNNAFQQQFSSGGTLLSITNALKAQGQSFSLPNLNTIVGSNDIGRVSEWNLEVQKSFGASTVVALNYVGNHGQNIFVRNPWLNTYCKPGKPGCASGEFGALPSSAPDPRFASVLELQSNGISNYHGLSASINRRITHGFSGTLNYNYSHSLDDVSNGGLSQYNLNNAANSFRIQLDPNNLKHINYGNSDYDFRHSLSANYFYVVPFKSANHYLDYAIGGWSLAGTFYYKTGEPYSVYNSTARTTNLVNTNGGAVLADFLGGSRNCDDGGVGCPTSSQFAFNNLPAPGLKSGNRAFQDNFGNLNRNSFRGPQFFSADFGINKDFKVKERMTFAFGATAFNVLNHANFDNPHGAVSSAATFGQLFQTISVPNSPYGNFTGAIVNGRVLQLDLKFKF